MSELSEQLNLTSIRDHGWHLQVYLPYIKCFNANWRGYPG